jgi:hypothetical protein
VNRQRVEGRPPLRHEQQPERFAPRGKRFFDWPAAGDELLPFADQGIPIDMWLARRSCAERRPRRIRATSIERRTARPVAVLTLRPWPRVRPIFARAVVTWAVVAGAIVTWRVVALVPGPWPIVARSIAALSVVPLVARLWSIVALVARTRPVVARPVVARPVVARPVVARSVVARSVRRWSGTTG